MFNTVLWQGMAEAQDSFYYGMYSILDSEPKVKFHAIPKNHELIEPYKDSDLVQILLWFAQDFYNVLPLEDGGVQFNNLRFGLLESMIERGESPYIVNYKIHRVNGEVTVEEVREMRNVKMGELLGDMWTRMKGI